jgi:hypothetical protein
LDEPLENTTAQRRRKDGEQEAVSNTGFEKLKKGMDCDLE